MKIIQINEYAYLYGGAEQHVFDSCQILVEAGHTVVLIAAICPSTQKMPGHKTYLLPRSYGVRTSLAVRSELQKIIRNEKPDLIHLYNVQGVLSPLLVMDLVRHVPVIRSVHDTRLICPGKEWKVLPGSGVACRYPLGTACFRQGCYPFRAEGRFPWHPLYYFILARFNLAVTRRLKHILVPSAYMRTELVRNGIPKARITVLTPYTDHNQTGDLPEINTAPPIILFVGRLEPIKGILNFIESLAFLGAGDWQVKIIGDGPQSDPARKLVKQLGLSRRVRFLGRLASDQLADYYRQCRLVVFPSMIPESFGRIGIEAMAYGKPVVAFDVGGVREWLRDGENGFMVKRGDQKGLADRMRRLLDDPGLCHRMGAHGKRRVEANFRKKNYTRTLLALYGQL